MTLQLFYAPTNVSFYRVSVLEVPENATNAWGYYTNTIHSAPPHIPDSGWDLLLSGNSIGDNCLLAPVAAPWSPGGFTWPIPVEWTIVGSNVTNALTSYNQVFSVDGSGIVKITKLGRSVQRTTNNVITTQ
jgi:hypothetical protein